MGLQTFVPAHTNNENGNGAKGRGIPHKPQGLSPAGRARIAAAQRLRWMRYKVARGLKPERPTKSQRLSAAVKARWDALPRGQGSQRAWQISARFQACIRIRNATLPGGSSEIPDRAVGHGGIGESRPNKGRAIGYCVEKVGVGEICEVQTCGRQICVGECCAVQVRGSKGRMSKIRAVKVCLKKF
jgi:hypothetical protein